MSDYNYIISFEDELKNDISSMRENLRHVKSLANGYDDDVDFEECVEEFNDSHKSAQHKVPKFFVFRNNLVRCNASRKRWSLWMISKNDNIK
jgi:hypothetical protein